MTLLLLPHTPTYLPRAQPNQYIISQSLHSPPVFPPENLTFLPLHSYSVLPSHFTLFHAVFLQVPRLSFLFFWPPNPTISLQFCLSPMCISLLMWSKPWKRGKNERGGGVKGAMGGNFEPHHVAMETVGVGREKEQSREEMGSTRGRGAWLFDCAGEMNV